MIEQSLKLLDDNWSLDIQLTGAISVAGTYPFKVYTKTFEATDWSEVFYGNKYLEVGESKPSFNITDILHFTRWLPSWNELNKTEKSLTPVKVICQCKVEVYGKDDTTLLGSGTTQYGNIFRYPARLELLEMMFGDNEVFLSQEIEPWGTVTNNMIQGMEYNKSSVQTGLLSTCQGYRLMPVYSPLLSDSSDQISMPFVFQCQNSSRNITYHLYKGKFNADTNQIIGSPKDLGLIPTGITSQLFSVQNDAAPANYDTLIGVWADNSSSTPSFDNVQIIARCDTKSPKQYYLLWQDRFGGFQSQPFCKTATYSESFENYEVKEYTNKRRAIQVNITPQWEINTGWIDADLYPFYESIFVSPFIILTDYENQQQFEVIIKDKEFIQKTFKNQGRKLFNIKLTLEKAALQQMTF